ncbi:hypothetical protein AB0I82_00105 [Streptomyces sp. NPDC050315]|uniref:hypothetical protein n=1 Tax=Streptomyces sp. NPDC050315 TaxID=3155039 RepID=UPI00344356B5
MNRDLRRDLYTVGAAVLLVVAAALAGTAIKRAKDVLHVGWPPLYATWLPHTGPGTPAAITLALAVVAHGPTLATRLPWRPLLWASWATATAWTFSLALVDGPHRGITRRLTTKYEYLQAIDRFHDIPGTVRDFTRHILLDSPAHWPPHVAGHPPGATLTFVLLDRIGLGGGAWAGTFVITVGATTAIAVLITVRALAGETLARHAAPFLILAPAAVWAGTSADGYFAAVAAWAVAFLALAVTDRHPQATGFAAGLLLGLTAYLSYGLTLFAAIAATTWLLGSRRLQILPYAIAGLTVVPAAFTAAGFNWWEAYHLLIERYHQGAGGFRPYSYWVWANLACTALVVGPATVAGLRRTAALLTQRHASPPADRRMGLLLCTALLILLTANLSGMSKAETERIWLPFTIWLLAAGTLLPHPRIWLTAQATLSLLLNHLLLTGW